MIEERGENTQNAMYSYLRGTWQSENLANERLALGYDVHCTSHSTSKSYDADLQACYRFLYLVIPHNARPKCSHTTNNIRGSKQQQEAKSHNKTPHFMRKKAERWALKLFTRMPCLHTFLDAACIAYALFSWVTCCLFGAKCEQKQRLVGIHLSSFALVHLVRQPIQAIHQWTKFAMGSIFALFRRSYHSN